MSRSHSLQVDQEHSETSSNFIHEPSQHSLQPNEADLLYALKGAELAHHAQQAEEDQGWADSSLLYNIHTLSKDNPAETNEFYEASKVAAELQEKSECIASDLQEAKRRVQKLEGALAEARHDFIEWEEERRQLAYYILENCRFYSTPSGGRS
jgi:hypothetical protein